MKVKDLRRLLAPLDDNVLVILSKDGEGNDYSPLVDFSKQTYVPDSQYSGEIYMPELTEEDKNDGYTEEDVYAGDDGVDAIVLWPTN